jgi:hypothetical protein
MTSKRYQRVTRGGALVLGVACAAFPALAAFSPASAAPASGSASQELKAAVAAANQQGSVRVTVHFFSGKTTGLVVQDSAKQSAVQTVAIGKERVSILLFNGNAYFSGNQSGLTSYFGLPKVVAATVGQRWISVSPSDSGFQAVVAGLSLPDALKEASPTGSITMGKMKKLSGQLTDSISGTGSTSVPPTTLFVSAAGRHLPVEAAATRGSGKGLSGEIIRFSRWGESVRVPTPTNPIPISTLSGGSTSTGSSGAGSTTAP